jgi:hypothetical protein
MTSHVSLDPGHYLHLIVPLYIRHYTHTRAASGWRCGLISINYDFEGEIIKKAAMTGRRLLPVLCGGAATRLRRKQRASRHPSASKLPAAATDGSKAAVKSPAGGGCYVNGNGALMVEVAGGVRRVMVVAGGRKEAAGALQWALSQAVRSNDTVVLLSVVKPVAQEGLGRSDPVQKFMLLLISCHLGL